VGSSVDTVAQVQARDDVTREQFENVSVRLNAPSEAPEAQPHRETEMNDAQRMAVVDRGEETMAVVVMLIASVESAVEVELIISAKYETMLFEGSLVSHPSQCWKTAQVSAWTQRAATRAT
jgi:hypothetical protein